MGKESIETSEEILQYSKTFLDLLDKLYSTVPSKNFSLKTLHDSLAFKIYEHLCNPPVSLKNSSYKVSTSYIPALS